MAVCCCTGFEKRIMKIEAKAVNASTSRIRVSSVSPAAGTKSTHTSIQTKSPENTAAEQGNYDMSSIDIDAQSKSKPSLKNEMSLSLIKADIHPTTVKVDDTQIEI